MRLEGLGIKIGLALLLCSLAAEAQSSGIDPAVKQACAATANAPLPAEMQGLPVPKSYPRCDSYKLYEKEEFGRARRCAVEERMALLARLPGSPAGPPPKGVESYEPAPAGGLVVLAELYANGEEVPRSQALAGRFFCEAVETGEIDSDPSFRKDVLAALERARTMTPESRRYAVCEVSVVTPALTRYCQQKDEEERDAMHAAGIQSGIDDAVHDAAEAKAGLKPVLAKLTPAERAEYRRLDAAFAAFVSHQVTGDVLFMGGYGSGGLYPDQERAGFEEQVTAWVKAAPPAQDAAAFGAADGALNAVYQKLIEAAGGQAALPHPAITAESLRGEQRAWLAYRNTFVRFGAALDPGLTATAWLVPLTAARTKDLQEVYDDRAASWVSSAQAHASWKSDIVASRAVELEQRRAQVAPYFDHQTPEQAAAWERVQAAVRRLALAHNAAVPHASPIYADQKLDEMYAELYAFQYNDQHGIASVVGAKARAALAANDKRLNDAYQTDLASTCLFKPWPGDPPAEHRTPDGLRGEERAWMELRDAWVGFLAMLFPEKDRTSLAKMITGARSFELAMLTKSCELSGGRAPKEQ